MMSLLSPYSPFPLAPAAPLWTDPFADFASPFSLLPAFGRAPDFPDMSSVARVEADDDKGLRIVFDGLGGYDQINVSIDDKANVVTVKAAAADGTARASRVMTLPCAVQDADKITAEQLGSRVVVTIPKESQKPRERAAEPAKAKPLNVALRPAAEPRAPEFEASEDEAGWMIKVHGVEPSSARVDVDGRKLHVACKAPGGSTEFARAFALPRAVVNADAIAAKLEGADVLVVTVPHDALEAKQQPAKASISVQKPMEVA